MLEKLYHQPLGHRIEARTRRTLSLVRPLMATARSAAPLATRSEIRRGVVPGLADWRTPRPLTLQPA